MPRDRAASDSRYFHEDYYTQDPQREHSIRRRHRHRDYDEEESSEARKQRRELRRADEARRQAELDIDELRARRESYYSRPDSERRREHQRMAQEIRVDSEKAQPRSAQKEVRRGGTRPRRQTTANDDDRSADFVYGRPQSRAAVEPVTARRLSTVRRSEEGGSSRTGYSPQSGSRSASLRKVETSKLSRGASTRDPRDPRDPTKVYMSTRPTLRRTSTLKVPTATASPIRVRSSSVREPPPSPQRKSTGGLLATLFKPPTRVPTMAVREPARVDCVICMNDDLPVHKTAKLGCGHRMCHSCIKRQFTLSVSDPQHMPPRCCSAEHIPLKYVERLFDDKFKKLWNKKYQEYTTGNRTYCPRKGCGEWIKPGKVRMDLTSGMKYARCGQCQTKVCVLCNSKFHTRRECPNDEETNRLVQMAKDQGWQRCYSCKAVVELKEGCNHMTCRCTAQFCMVCAAPWKTCNCPWFNYNHMDDSDRLNDMRVPYIPREEVVEVIEMPLEHSAPPVRRSSTRPRPRGEDRDLQRADEALAAHLQAQLRVSQPTIASESRRRDPDVQVYGLGNAGAHHMNESYTRQPLTTAAARTAARVSASTPRFFSRRLVPAQETAPTQGPLRVPPGSVRAPPRPAVPARPAVRTAPPTVSSSTMAGLSLSGRKVGANRVGTWLNHIQMDTEAIGTAPQYVDVDDWRIEGSMVGID